MTTFLNLPPKQSEVFEQIAIGNDAGHPQTIIVPLLRKGLITEIQEKTRDRFGEFSIYRYEVPLPIHMEWCAWCAQQEDK